MQWLLFVKLPPLVEAFDINNNLLEQDIAIVCDLANKATISKTLADICDDITAGGTPNRKNQEFWDSPDYIWFKNGEVKNNILLDSEEHISQKGVDGSSAQMIPPNSILFAMYCVSTPQLAINIKTCTTNQAVCSLIISDFDIMCYIYNYMMCFGTKLTNLANGAAQQNLNKGMISSFAVDLPEIKIIRNSPLSSHIQMRKHIAEENDRLTKLRDLLLPKLMSGDLDVSDINL